MPKSKEELEEEKRLAALENKDDNQDDDDLEDDEEEEDDELDPGAPGDKKKGGKGGKDGKKGKMVMISEDALKAIVEENRETNKRLDMLESNAAATLPGGIKRSSKKETKIKVRFWDGKPVLGWENVGSPEKPKYVYSEYNNLTRESVEFINVICLGADGKEEKAQKLNYVEFLRGSEVQYCLMKKRIELEDEVEEQGIVYKKGFAENGYGMFETTIAVPVEVITKHYEYEVIIDEKTGKTLTLNETFVG